MGFGGHATIKLFLRTRRDQVGSELRGRAKGANSVRVMGRQTEFEKPIQAMDPSKREPNETQRQRGKDCRLLVA